MIWMPVKKTEDKKTDVSKVAETMNENLKKMQKDAIEKSIKGIDNQMEMLRQRKSQLQERLKNL